MTLSRKFPSLLEENGNDMILQGTYFSTSYHMEGINCSEVDCLIKARNLHDMWLSKWAPYNLTNFMSHTIRVWHIYLHLIDLYDKCM